MIIFNYHLVRRSNGYIRFEWSIKWPTINVEMFFGWLQKFHLAVIHPQLSSSRNCWTVRQSQSLVSPDLIRAAGFVMSTADTTWSAFYDYSIVQSCKNFNCFLRTKKWAIEYAFNRRAPMSLRSEIHVFCVRRQFGWIVSSKWNFTVHMQNHVITNEIVIFPLI